MMHVTGDSSDVTTYFVLRLAADGTELTGATITNIDLQYVRSGAAPSAKVDATALAATDSAHADNKAIEIDATDAPGLYRVDWPDAAFAAGVKEVILSVKYATAFTEHLRVMIDAPVNVTKANGTAITALNFTSKISQIYSDTTIIYSDTTIATSKTTQIYSDTTIIYSDTTLISSDAARIESKAVQIYSDTTAIHAQTTTIASDAARIESKAVQIYSDTTITSSKAVQIYSDTTIIYSDTTVATSKTTQIYSDTTIIYSDTTLISSDAARVESKAVQIYSDTTAINTQTTTIASDAARIESKAVQIYSDTTISSSKVVQIYSDTTIIYSDTTLISADGPNTPTKGAQFDNFEFMMVDSTDLNTPETGITVTATISKDGAAFAACTNSVSEISGGWYKITLTSTEMNADAIALKFTGTGCAQRNVYLRTQPT